AVLEDAHLPAGLSGERLQDRLGRGERVVGHEGDRLAVTPAGRARGQGGRHECGEEESGGTTTHQDAPWGWIASRTPSRTRMLAGGSTISFLPPTGEAGGSWAS